ncbi:HAMP domain-containing sensor histidine kinase [Clostridium sp. BJN0001]|uniref:sensor histidine kinase n=1 Tax=Clostridium sp. BJN0001 TaxID=2930219 RepID=UPI001FD3446B|nr:HAMP domain-containing sensor histidine kinase [Clostridium sp. BJN0001]
MKTATIKFKLFIIFTTLMSLMILAVILLNTFFLKSFYTYKTKGILKNISMTIVDNYENNIDYIYEYIDSISKSDGISTIIVDNSLNIEYNSLNLRLSQKKKLIDIDLKRMILDEQKENSAKDKYFVHQTKAKEDNMTKIMSITRIDSNKYLILIKYINGIQNNASIANEFFIIAGFIVILLGSVIILIFSRKITKPIVEMSKVSENISNLKFDKIVNVKSNDEIGTLGKSINEISDKLSKNINDLKHDVERRKMLVRDMSHELKTPISIIKGYVEGLKYGVANNDEKRDKYYKVIVNECDRMDELIKQLLDYSMMEGSLISLNISNFNANDFIEDAVKRFKPLFEEKNIDVNIECREDIILNADRELLEKALNNYLLNAVNYCIAKENKKEINIKGILREDNFLLSVFNTGNNIPKNELNKIWDVCYRVDKARTREYGGHGIGLSLVKLISKLHKGKCSVVNLENGVIFIIEIPNIKKIFSISHKFHIK